MPLLEIPSWLRALLAFIAGWTDVATFIALDHLMAAHITGNLVLVAADLVDGVSLSEILRLAAIPMFFVTIMLVTLVHDRLLSGRPRGTRFRRLLIVEALLLAGLSGLALARELSPVLAGNSITVILGLLAVMAMAVQNATHQLFPGFGAATTVMTGNIARLMVEFSRSLVPPIAPQTQYTEHHRDRITLATISGFVLGCLISAWLTTRLGLAMLLAPALVLLLVASLIRLHNQNRD
ncbi:MULTISPECIES: YoaK family protein [Thiorhodovibrio]|uniref:YoaK family protein n=1 Tax=Thiorhodovibrio TaxID=61593 RepID=UPI00191373DF|nr:MULTISPECIES: YoaK family protein [Thiorhodovibrio]WPL10773.1 putative membrane protein [Thiorhodovibrio litoralis]